jgi:hypothetical protein
MEREDDMVNWPDVRVQEYRRAELMKEAELARLASAARAGLPNRRERLAALMIRLGAWMERTGCRLQARFAVIEASAMIDPQAAEAQMNGCA